jgi:hypothetical protein
MEVGFMKFSKWFLRLMGLAGTSFAVLLLAFSVLFYADDAGIESSAEAGPLGRLVHRVRQARSQVRCNVQSRVNARISRRCAVHIVPVPDYPVVPDAPEPQPAPPDDGGGDDINPPE